MERPLLSPHNKLPEPYQGALLIVGCEGIGKHRLAQAILAIDHSFKLEIHTASSLPLVNEQHRPKIDYIVFMADLTKELSMKILESSVGEISVQYFLSRCCIVACKANLGQRSTEFQAVSSLADVHNMPIVCGSMQGTGGNILAQRIMHLFRSSAGFVSGVVSPSLVSATRLPGKTARFTQEL